MLLRAVFWIGLVWLLMPHIPDSAAPRPLPAPLVRLVRGWTQELAAPSSSGTRSLAAVKAEIAQSLKARARHAGPP